MAEHDKRTDDRHREAKEAEAKRIEDNKRAEDERKKADEERRKTAAERALVPNAEGNVIVECIMGPYRGQNITMTEADGTAAIGAHWARDPTEAIYEHEPLSEEERTAAVDASHAWAQAQWDAAQGIEQEQPPPPEGGDGGVARRRSMAPARPAPGYQTRTVEPKP
jgi:hypothetical protein